MDGLVDIACCYVFRGGPHSMTVASGNATGVTTVTA